MGSMYTSFLCLSAIFPFFPVQILITLLVTFECVDEKVPLEIFGFTFPRLLLRIENGKLNMRKKKSPRVFPDMD